jgi:flagellar biosynthesis protein FlhF
MELKTFQARSMSDALAQVKSGLGRNAVILHTRTIKRGGWFGIGARSLVEITATNDPRVLEARTAWREAEGSGGRPVRPARPAVRDTAAVPPDQAAAPSPTKGPSVEIPLRSAADPELRREVEEIRNMVANLVRQTERSRLPRVPAELIEYYTDLIGQEVAEELAGQIIERLSERLRSGEEAAPVGGSQPQEGSSAGASPCVEWVGEELHRIICEMLPPAEPLRLTATDRPTIVALVGPTGVGKTTTIAKLAANMKLREGKSVGLITIDAYRIAAVEQLKVYAQILGVPLAAVVTVEEMQAALREMSGVDLILVDTAGRSQRDEPRIAELGELLAAARPDQVHLVLAATSREPTIREAIKNFSALGVEYLIFTKLDEAIGFGVILNVLRSVNMRLSYLSAGQSVPNDLEEGSGRRIARLIVESARRLDGVRVEAAPEATVASPPAESAVGKGN